VLDLTCVFVCVNVCSISRLYHPHGVNLTVQYSVSLSL